MSIKKKIELEIDATSLGALENQLEGVNKELKEVELGSDRFKELTKQSQLLNKEITKINNEIEGFQFEDKIMAADGAAKIFGGSLSAAVGTLGALGIESEAFGEFEQKAASAIAVGLGIKDVSEGFGQVAIAAKKSGIATKLFGTTTKKALIATGLGVFVVALGTIIAYWDDINKGVKRFLSNAPFIGKAVDAVKGAFDSLFEAAKPILTFLGILPSEAEIAQQKIKDLTSQTVQELEREIALATAAGNKSARDMFNLRKRLMEAELQQMRDNNDEKETIFKKETELLALEAAEQKRIREEKGEGLEREKVQTVSAIQAKGMAEVETDKATADTINIRKEEDLDKRERLIQSEIALQGKLDAAKQASLDNVIAIAGAESGIGKAAFIAKQVLAAREMFLEASKTIAFSSQAVARSTVAVAQGTAETAKIGFPQNIPLLIGYAAQAAGIISAVKQSVSSAKSARSGSMVATPSFRGAAVAAPAPPSFNIVGESETNQLAQLIGGQEQQPVKAFVVSNEVTNAQALDRNIVNSASLG